jgi:acetyl-CoA synthetase
MTSFAEARATLLAHRSDHAAAVGAFRWPDVTGFNWAFDWFDSVLASEPGTADRDALVIVDGNGEERVSFRDLAAQSNRLVRYLDSLGIGRGDRVLVMLGNVRPLWEIMLAAIKLGAVVVPATPMLTSDELLDRVQRGRVKLAITSAEEAPKFDSLSGIEFARIVVGGARAGWHDYADAQRFDDGPLDLVRPGCDDPLLLYFTSGTTAKPKLVMHSQSSYPVGALSTMYWLGLQPGDMHLNISSPGWAKHAWSSLFAPWNAGATIMVFNQPRFSAAALLDLLASHSISTVCAPPTVWRMIVQQELPARPHALRELCSAGEPLNAEIIAQVREAWGITIRDGYGQTETTALVGNTPGEPVVPGAMGRPLPGYRLEIRDADGMHAEEGEVCVETDGERPLGLMCGYLAADGELEGVDGAYYRTGDVAFRDEHGRFTFVGRADDVFKSSDYRISPFELESALIEHPLVAEAAVVPAPDAVRLSIPKAYVILAAGADASRETAASIFVHLKERLAPYKRIRRLEFVAELPKTISGKIRRVQLRRQEVESAQAQRRSENEFREDELGHPVPVSDTVRI